MDASSVLLVACGDYCSVERVVIVVDGLTYQIKIQSVLVVDYSLSEPF